VSSPASNALSCIGQAQTPFVTSDRSRLFVAQAVTKLHGQISSWYGLVRLQPSTPAGNRWSAWRSGRYRLRVSGVPRPSRRLPLYPGCHSNHSHSARPIVSSLS
jgi:hypothetical protein